MPGKVYGKSVSQPFLAISRWIFFFSSFIHSVEAAAQLVSGFLSEEVVLCVAVDCVQGRRQIYFT